MEQKKADIGKYDGGVACPVDGHNEGVHFRNLRLT